MIAPRGDDKEQRVGYTVTLCWLGTLGLSKFQASLKAWESHTPSLTDPKSASYHRRRWAGEGNLRGKQKERCAEAPVLPGAQLQEPRVKGDSLCWRVSSPHEWEDSPLGGLSGLLGFLALSQVPCSPAPCTDPQAVLSLLWELWEVVSLRHWTLCLPQRYSDLGLLFPFLASWNEGAVWRRGSLDEGLRWWPGARVLSEWASMSGACPRAAGSSPEKGEEEAHGYVK